MSGNVWSAVFFDELARPVKYSAAAAFLLGLAGAFLATLSGYDPVYAMAGFCAAAPVLGIIRSFTEVNEKAKNNSGDYISDAGYTGVTAGTVLVVAAFLLLCSYLASPSAGNVSIDLLQAVNGAHFAIVLS